MHRTVLLASLIDVFACYQKPNYLILMLPVSHRSNRIQISHQRRDTHQITMLAQVNKPHDWQANLWIQQGIVYGSLALIIRLVDGVAVACEELAAGDCEGVRLVEVVHEGGLWTFIWFLDLFYEKCSVDLVRDLLYDRLPNLIYLHM